MHFLHQCGFLDSRKGLASGVVISGIGSGVLFFAPMMDLLMSKTARLPVYLGNSLEVLHENGRVLARIGDQLSEVVFASAAELSKERCMKIYWDFPS